jgi:hypothetical protein
VKAVCKPFRISLLLTSPDVNILISNKIFLPESQIGVGAQRLKGGFPPNVKLTRYQF